MKNWCLLLIAAFWLIEVHEAQSRNINGNAVLTDQVCQQDTTRMLVALVTDAAEQVRLKGETIFNEFRLPDSRWQTGETYIFVLDPEGNMLVHADPEMEGKNQLNLKDINGKPIVKGLLAAAMTFPDKPEGWYHYQWPVPGGLLPRWKSSYVRLVTAPSGHRYVVGSGMYNDQMEREFVIDIVKDAVGQIEKNGESAFRLFHDPTSPFLAKDAYIFVFDDKGTDLVNPAFPNLEGRNLMELKDTRGKLIVQEMFNLVQRSGTGWVDYMWPKPGESISTLKSAYVSQARIGNKQYLVGCGVYLADAPKEISMTKKMTAPELMSLVREGAGLLEKQGEQAYPEFRQKGSKWFKDDTYLFVWTLDGVRAFHAANPDGEGLRVIDSQDVIGRPWGNMLVESIQNPKGEGWVHYMYPRPGDIFPTWKSSFAKKVTFPSGKEYLVGCGIYNMQMDKSFIEDVVNHAAELVDAKGKDAFAALRDKTGPFVFMDTYVFVDDINGVELVNPAQPSMEGKNLINVKDTNGKLVVRDYIDAALKHGSAWIDYYWYRPGENTPALKHTYVRKVKYGKETYILGAGLYAEDEANGKRTVE
jgi:signal transduction histidine kinase